METEKGKSLPAVKDFQIDSSWAPVTPAKPTLPKPRPIYADEQEIRSSQAFTVESEDYLLDIDHGEEKEVVNSKELLERSPCVVSPKGNTSRCINAIESGDKMPYEPRVPRGGIHIIDAETASTSGETRMMDDITSSQHSVLSSQTSIDSASNPTWGMVGSCSESNSEAEDLTTSSNPYFDHPAYFVELLKMAEAPKQLEASIHKDDPITSCGKQLNKPGELKHDKEGRGAFESDSEAEDLTTSSNPYFDHPAYFVELLKMAEAPKQLEASIHKDDPITSYRKQLNKPGELKHDKEGRGAFESDSEAEDLTTSSNPYFDHPACFVELLKMAEAPKQLEASIHKDDPITSYRKQLNKPGELKHDKEGRGAFESDSEAEDLTTSSNPYFDHPACFVELLKMAEAPEQLEASIHKDDPITSYRKQLNKPGELKHDKEGRGAFGAELPRSSLEEPNVSNNNHLRLKTNSQLHVANFIEIIDEESRSSNDSTRKDDKCTTEQSELTTESIIQSPSQDKISEAMLTPENLCSCYVLEGERMVVQSHIRVRDPKDIANSSAQETLMQKETNVPTGAMAGVSQNTSPFYDKRKKNGHVNTEKNSPHDHASGEMYNMAQDNGKKRERTANTVDSLDYEAVRCADVSEIADTIKERGVNNMLAERIKDFLNRLVSEHGSIDLEWLRDRIRAKHTRLGFEKRRVCKAFDTPSSSVDTNVGRIAVQLGWVPLQPLPESLQLHLLELYELHYHMITFGKVFCTKRQTNCNACPLRGECRHFASAFARLALPGPEERSILASTHCGVANQDPQVTINTFALKPQAHQLSETKLEITNIEPIIEVPASPEPEVLQTLECDIKDTYYEDANEIPTIKLNMEQFTQTLQTYMEANKELQPADMSKALVALIAEAASIPTPKLKNVSRLRTEHHV
ncbi:hypothetical protein Ancab_014429 [Ancistrocladus abbreviatus]